VDTVFDLDNSGLGLNKANGFTFRDANTASLDYGLGRAVRLWYDNPEAFNRLARNGMRYDYSWRHPTEHYENIYNYIKV
jgi:starch synthase